MSPLEIGARATEQFLAQPIPAPLNYEGSTRQRDKFGYAESCAWYGALTFAAAARNRTQLQRFTARYATGAERDLIPNGDPRHPMSFYGDPVFGIVPLEMYLQTDDIRYLTTGIDLADQQWSPPPSDIPLPISQERRRIVQSAIEQDLSWQTLFWIDEAYILNMLQVQAYRATGDAKYIDRASRQMLAYVDLLQQPNGLFRHTSSAPLYWGRANGWGASGMTELLSAMPGNHGARSQVLDSFHRLMDALLQLQGSDGLWRQLLDRPNAWSETSCTAMFVYAFSTGVKANWLDADQFAPAAQRGWLALAAQTDEHGNLRGISEGCDQSPHEEYYLTRRRMTGDLHGQAALLWAARALL